MKMYLGKTPMKSLNIKHYELSSNDCTMVPSDLQAGITGVAKGKKIVGTGKSFEFAYYGDLTTNSKRYVPTNINVIEISSIDYPVKSTLQLKHINKVDFSINQNVATVFIDGVEYTLSASVVSNMLTISCEKDIQLQVFYGKDNYV